MRLLRISFLATLIAAITYGSMGAEVGQETDEQFILRMCGLMGWQREYVDIELCRMIEEELARWK